MNSTSVTAILASFTTGIEAEIVPIVTSVLAWFGPKLLTLTMQVIDQIAAGVKHLVANLRAGMAWGAAVASMLTEVWNEVQSDMSAFATDIAEAIAKVLQNVGLVPASA